MHAVSHALVVSACLAASSATWADPASRDETAIRGRILTFLVNAHTGQQMTADHWLTKNARDAPAFAGFGGLRSLINQSTARAEEFGGLRTVEIIELNPQPGGYKVTSKVLFVRNHKRANDRSASASDDMIWPFSVVRDKGMWKIDR